MRDCKAVAKPVAKPMVRCMGNNQIGLKKRNVQAFGRGANGLMNKMFVSILLVLVIGFLPGLAVNAQNAANVRQFSNASLVNGAVTLDTKGTIRTVLDQSLTFTSNELFAVDQNGVPTQFNMFYFGFDVYRDMETVGNNDGNLTGILGLDKFGGIHKYRVTTAPGRVPTTAGVSLTSPFSTNPEFDYQSDVAVFNVENPASPVSLPYFPFEIAIETPNDGVARDLELAVDFRQATNGFQGYYMLDAFAGVHYINNAEVLDFLNRNPGQAGNNLFRDIFGFRPSYTSDYAGKDANGNTVTKAAPYFMFDGGTGFPIAKDLEVLVRFDKITTPSVADSQTRSELAATNGIDETKMFEKIAISDSRLSVANPDYASEAAVTSGYAILDGYGAVHAMLEDASGNPIPAPWENADTGGADPSVDAPYFANPPFDDGNDFNIAIDIEMMPNGQGFCMLTRLGEVFVVNAVGTSAADNFTQVGLEENLPIFGFDAARNLELVANAEGKIVGMYVVDRFGTIHRVGQVPRLPGNSLYFRGGFAEDLELSPKPRPITAPSGN